MSMLGVNRERERERERKLTFSVVKAPVNCVEDEAERSVLLIDLDVVCLILAHQWKLSLTHKLHNRSFILHIILKIDNQSKSPIKSNHHLKPVHIMF